MMKKAIFIFIFSSIFVYNLQSQISLSNSSFEGEPMDATMPVGWLKCELGTTPDILPGPWGVYTEPSEGDTYVGLITREDGTFESIGQRLRKKMEKGNCYTISLDLAFSNTYAGYNNPVKLRIWGGETRCAKDQLLIESGFIDNTEWEKHKFKFISKHNLNYIIIEAFYKEGDFSHKGNILIDNISDIKLCRKA